MELCLINNDPTQTVLVTPDGRPIYEMSTPRQQSSDITTVRRLHSHASAGQVSTEIARIEHQEALGTRLSLWTHNLDLVLRSDQSELCDSSWAFTGPDGLPYKWQLFIHYPVLMLNDNSQTPLARYRRAKLGIVSRSRRAFLEVLPAGIAIIDMVVVTFTSFMKQRMRCEMEQQKDGHS